MFQSKLYIIVKSLVTVRIPFVLRRFVCVFVLFIFSIMELFSHDYYVQFLFSQDVCLVILKLHLGLPIIRFSVVIVFIRFRQNIHMTWLSMAGCIKFLGIFSVFVHVGLIGNQLLSVMGNPDSCGHLLDFFFSIGYFWISGSLADLLWCLSWLFALNICRAIFFINHPALFMTTVAFLVWDCICKIATSSCCISSLLLSLIVLIYVLMSCLSRNVLQLAL